MSEGLINSSERLATTTSVAVLLTNDPNHVHELILVRKRDSGKWGLPAGGLKRNDSTAMAAIKREIMEETGWNEDKINLNPAIGVETIIVHGENKSSVGLIFSGSLKTPISTDGFKPDNAEIDWVKPFSIDELLELIRLNPETVFKPDFNIEAIKQWLRGYVDLKYGTWEGEEFANEIMKSWDIC